MYHNFLKEVNSDSKYLRFTDLRDNNFEVLLSATTLDKIDLDCAENVRAKPTVNNSGFITYSNTINFSTKWLDKNGYILTQCFFL